MCPESCTYVWRSTWSSFVDLCLPFPHCYSCVKTFPQECVRRSVPQEYCQNEPQERPTKLSCKKRCKRISHKCPATVCCKSVLQECVQEHLSCTSVPPEFLTKGSYKSIHKSHPRTSPTRESARIVSQGCCV